ncbi:hypothetical protein N9137_00750 [Pseudomonadales bacterium]|nr:hypothetical protein [Pseudomonadales bacterium]
MTTISIEYILHLMEERAKINSLDLNEIVFTENGQPVDIPQELIEKFLYTGLNNMDFISSQYYKGVETYEPVFCKGLKNTQGDNL